MPKTIEITLTQLGFEVHIGRRRATFHSLEDAVHFARAHLARAEEIRDTQTRFY